MLLRPRWRKVFRDLWQEKSRTGIVVASIAVGIIAFGGLFGTRNIVSQNIAIEYQRFNENDVVFELDGFDEALVRWAARQDFVTDAQGVTVYNATAPNIDGEEEDVVLTAFEDYSDIRINRLVPEAGRFPPQRGQVVVERSYTGAIAQEIGTSFVVEGDNDTVISLAYIGTAHDLNAFPNSVDPRIKLYVTPRTLRLLDFDTAFNQLYLTLDRDAIARAGTELETVTEDLRESISRLGVDVNGVRVNRDDNLWSGDFAVAIASILFFVGSAAVILSGFLVLNVITGLLARQRRQIGVMKMIGASGAQIAGLYLVLVGTFGVLALALALPMSRVLAEFVAGGLLSVGFLNVGITVVQIPLLVFIVQIIVAIAAPIIAALVPIARSARLSPIESLRETTVANSDWLDRALAKLRGLPRPVLLTLRNTFRRKARLVATLITLIVAGAFFMAALNLRVSVLREATTISLAGSDLRFTLARTADRSGVLRRVETVSGVTGGEGWLIDTVRRVRPDGTESDSLTLNGVPAETPYNAPSLTEGRWIEPLTADNRFEIVISTEFETLEPGVGVGDTLRLTFDGDEADWQVVGIVETGGPTSVTPPLYAAYDTVSRFVEAPEQSNFILVSTLADTFALERDTEQHILDALDRLGVDVVASSITLEESENARNSFDVIIFLLAFVALIIAIVGGFGLGGTMSLNVMERTREIGVMRSVGASSNTLRGMYVLEAVLIGGMSYVLALPVSLLVSYGFARAIGGIFGLDRALEFGVNPLGLLMWAVIIVIVAVLASLVPAQRASSISIREALAYE